MFATGCSTAWISQAEEIIAAVIPATTNIVTLVEALQGKSISAADLQLIQNAGTQANSDLQLISSLITAYNQAEASAQPGILNQIQTVANTVQSNLSALLPALHITDQATQAKITAIVGLVVSEVQSLIAIVPLVDPNASAAKVAQATRQATKNPPLTARQFILSYNDNMKAKTGNVTLDKVTSGLQIHTHSKAVRWLTLGYQQ
jgi:hypothetical protein